MHPKIAFPGDFAPLFEQLSAPLYDVAICEDARRAGDGEVDCRGGVTIVTENVDALYADVLLDDLRDFLTIAMNLRITDDGYPIRLRCGVDIDCPEDVGEAHRIAVTNDGCDLSAADLDGLRRAVFRLEDEMRLRRAPLLPIGDETRWTTVGPRIIRSPVAAYRWLSGWELEDDHDYYPDPYLNRLAHSGINGIWITGLLRNMVASATIPELGPPAHRLDKLQALVARAARYGISVYLFCIEPRALSEGHPAAIAHPEIVGSRGALCTSEPVVLEYVRETMRVLFTEVPDLAGVINIFNGERMTTCWRNDESVRDCPRCRVRPQAEVLGATLNAFMDGIRDASATAELLAWTYMMDPKTHSMTTLPIAPMLDVLRQSRDDITWLGNFEHGGVKELCGREVEVHEYALSYVGPSENFADLAREAVAEGRRVYAKIQIGASYELATVPHIPAPGIVWEKFAGMTAHGATGTMLGWIPGGFPSPMLKAVGEATFEPRLPKDRFLNRLAAIEWGEASAETVVTAWEQFAAAWQQYPFNNAVLYRGPITRGPTYHLHLEREARLATPYNWGMNRKRVLQPFEDRVDRWLGPYTVAEIVESFRGMAASWQDAVALLPEPRDDAQRRQAAVAAACCLHFLAAAGVYEFYALRNQLLERHVSEHAALLTSMKAIGEESIRIAEEMAALQRTEPAIGHHPEMYTFTYNASSLAEKVAAVRDVLTVLDGWLENGIDVDILRCTVEDAELAGPGRLPDRWGD